jgi:hypothetical protein
MEHQWQLWQGAKIVTGSALSPSLESGCEKTQPQGQECCRAA